MINELLTKYRSEILEIWVRNMYATYPAQTEKFLKKEKDPFANPVGVTIKHSFTSVFDELAGKMETQVIDSSLEDIIRIRAVQELPPSDALSFISLLKQTLVTVFTENHENNISTEEWLSLLAKIDDISLRSFDIYMKCREKIYSLKADEIKRTNYRFLQKANSDTNNESV